MRDPRGFVGLSAPPRDYSLKAGGRTLVDGAGSPGLRSRSARSRALEELLMATRAVSSWSFGTDPGVIGALPLLTSRGFRKDGRARCAAPYSWTRPPSRAKQYGKSRSCLSGNTWKKIGKARGRSRPFSDAERSKSSSAKRVTRAVGSDAVGRHPGVPGEAPSAYWRPSAAIRARSVATSKATSSTRSSVRSAVRYAEIVSTATAAARGTG